MRAAFTDNTFILCAALHMRNGPRFTFHWKFSRAVAYCNAGICQQLYDRYTIVHTEVLLALIEFGRGASIIIIKTGDVGQNAFNVWLVTKEVASRKYDLPTPFQNRGSTSISPRNFSSSCWSAKFSETGLRLWDDPVS